MGSSSLARRALATAVMVAAANATWAQSVPAASTGHPAKADPAPSAPPDAAGHAPAPRRSVSELRYKDTKPPPGAWRGPVGKWATGIGLALLVGGATVAALNRDLSDDLDARFYKNRLTSADAAKYDRVETYNLLSSTMLIAGGAAAAAGIVLWSTAPDVRPVRGGATFGIQGRF